MRSLISMRCFSRSILGFTIPMLLASLLAVQAQQQPIGVPVPPLGAGPFVVDTAEQHKIRVTVVTKGLVHPWSLVFLPDGGTLVTERPGRIRLVRDGLLDPKPLGGVPQTRTKGNGGLMDIALHPRFTENHLVYFTYDKPIDNDKGAPAVARGRLEGGALADVRDLLVTDAYEGTGGLSGRIAFGRDGMLYMATGGNVGQVAQSPASLRGKILRMRDDGSAAPDNPFIGAAGYRPEIYTLGHRNPLGLYIHPTTGELWSTEDGPQGGDELNIIKAGRNYGWPIVSLGRNYDGTIVGEGFTKPGLEEPLVFWVPAIAISGLSIYNGDAFPAWKGHAFVGAMRANTGQHIQRVWFNAKGEPIGREIFLAELKQRIREVKPGPDGFLYALTDETFGAVLKIEPASTGPAR